jgi:hypothetical protein
MGGAKRYPSIAFCEDDGFREELNPSYALLQSAARIEAEGVIRHLGDQHGGSRTACTCASLPHCASHGLTSATPVDPKSTTLRVTTVKP